MKRIGIKEFREKGYLQEVNRKFFHPLGLALEISIEDDGTEKLGGIWDYRHEDEGIYYDLATYREDRKNTKEKKDFVANEFKTRSIKRKKILGFIVEPVK